MNTGYKFAGIFVLCTVLVAGSLFAQTVLLQVDRGADSIPSQRGPNLKKFSHGYLYLGFVDGADKQGGRILYGSSIDLGFGARKKYRISSLYSLGWELGMNEKIFKLKQENGKMVPDSVLNDVERIETTSLVAAFYNRINFDTHRGNYMGTFLDLGISGIWDFEITHVIKNILPDGSNIKSLISGLPYVNHFNYSVFARFGISHASLYATCRLSKLFKSGYNYPELPWLTTGIELGIFRQ